ncbi:MAG TPA: peptidoglycan DD-metalloendopeptidase family protein, partial [Gaiellaceae bacterium]|nr:peptidoglycan DD-metalloendopeptidase family protein [Gaiellaceae bacterium]
VQGPVVQPFNYDESHPYAAGQHRGIDIAADATGETVRAPADGTVSFAGTVPTNGETVTIETTDGYSVTLTHLGSILVSRGAELAEGDPIGTVGPSGTPELDEPYVHLGIRVTADQNGYVDPLGLLPPPVTQPGGSDGSSSGTQPVASGGSSATTPTIQPAPVSATAPAPTAQETQAPPARGASHARWQTSRADKGARTSSQRPSVSEPTARSPRSESHQPLPHRRLSQPVSASRRPVVEAAATEELSDLDTGHESAPRPSEPRHSGVSRQQAAPALTTLACNGAAALIAVVAAIAAARRRRRYLASAPVGAQVIRLARAAPEPRARRAA